MKITNQIVLKHGLKLEEFENIKKLLKREPNLLELGIFSAMWNEHCSYKSSKIHLKKLPTKGKQVIQGPGENAGVIDIGDNDAIIFKIESHNHPSYIEPYQEGSYWCRWYIERCFYDGCKTNSFVKFYSFRFTRSSKN